MTPKEKAQELKSTFYKALFSQWANGDAKVELSREITEAQAKQCALIVVDETIKVAPLDMLFKEAPEEGWIVYEEYWREVRKEIEKS